MSSKSKFLLHRYFVTSYSLGCALEEVEILSKSDAEIRIIDGESLIRKHHVQVDDDLA